MRIKNSFSYLNILLICILVMPFTFKIRNAMADDYYDQHAKGWHWYDDPKEKTEQEEEKKLTSQDSIEQMDVVKKTIQRALDTAVLDPTPEHVKNYIALQNQLMRQSKQFSNIWQETLLENPQLDYSLVHPTDNTARQIEEDQQQLKEKAAIKKLSEESGLFFFYKSTCPYCQRFAPILKRFAESYGLVVIPITMDGVSLPEFPNSMVDHGQAAAFHVTVEPSLFAVNPYTKKAYPVAFGFMSEADLSQRILKIATHFGVDEA